MVYLQDQGLGILCSNNVVGIMKNTIQKVPMGWAEDSVGLAVNQDAMKTLLVVIKGMI